jgi:hypothetical protein
LKERSQHKLGKEQMIYLYAMWANFIDPKIALKMILVFGESIYGAIFRYLRLYRGVTGRNPKI